MIQKNLYKIFEQKQFSKNNLAHIAARTLTHTARQTDRHTDIQTHTEVSTTKNMHVHFLNISINTHPQTYINFYVCT